MSAPAMTPHAMGRELNEAAAGGNAAEVEKLLVSGAPVDWKISVSPAKHSALPAQCKMRDSREAGRARSVRASAHQRAGTATPQFGSTALMQAASCGHLATMRVLIKHGADLEAQTRVSSRKCDP